MFTKIFPLVDLVVRLALPVYGGVSCVGSGFDPHKKISLNSLHVYVFFDILNPTSTTSAVVLIVVNHGLSVRSSFPGHHRLEGGHTYPLIYHRLVLGLYDSHINFM